MELTTEVAKALPLLADLADRPGDINECQEITLFTKWIGYFLCCA
jgi:hypothetical protein